MSTTSCLKAKKKRSNMLKELFRKTKKGEHELEGRSKGDRKDKWTVREN